MKKKFEILSKGDIYLNYKQYMWLKRHGDRTVEHVRKDDTTLFVWMFCPGGDEKIYLPQ